MRNSHIVEITDSVLGIKNGNRVFTSLEGENPGGSIKDHMVLGEIQKLLISKNTEFTGISEVSSGSTARALAYYCRLHGFKCELFVPDTVSLTLIKDLENLGAKIHTSNLNNIYSIYDSFSASHPELMRLNQMFDQNKKKHYHFLAKKITNILGNINAVIGAIGTGHSLIGITESMSRSNVVSAEPEPSFRISGVRNIEIEKYGDSDLENKLHSRVIISKLDMPELATINTSAGLVEITPSFLLALKATQIYLRDKRNHTVFSIGASNKRLNLTSLRKAS